MFPAIFAYSVLFLINLRHLLYRHQLIAEIKLVDLVLLALIIVHFPLFWQKFNRIVHF